MFENNNCKLSYHRNWTHPLPDKAEEVKAVKNEITQTEDKAVIKELKSTLSSLTVPFRTTWTAGYYIEMLGNQGWVWRCRLKMTVLAIACVHVCMSACVYVSVRYSHKCCVTCDRYYICE